MNSPMYPSSIISHVLLNDIFSIFETLHAFSFSLAYPTLSPMYSLSFLLLSSILVQISSISPASPQILHIIILAENILEIVNFKLFILCRREIKFRATKQNIDKSPFSLSSFWNLHITRKCWWEKRICRSLWNSRSPKA